MPGNTHKPVLLKESIDYLNLEEGDTIIDATIGLGGHAEAILKKIGSSGKLIGLDIDSSSLDKIKTSLSNYPNVILNHENFSNLDKVLSKLNIKTIDGIIFDLGISSFQLNSPMRGFSFQEDGPLDMRINHNQSITAEKIINTFSEDVLISVFKNYGEEKFSNKIAHLIVNYRKTEKITSTLKLARIITKAIPRLSYNNRRKTLARIFQAIRIKVNHELDSLENGLKIAANYLKPGGRIVVISFHSLEDRIVKSFFKAQNKIKLNILTKKVIIADRSELKYNMRAKSAKLRAAEKLP